MALKTIDQLAEEIPSRAGVASTVQSLCAAAEWPAVDINLLKAVSETDDPRQLLLVALERVKGQVKKKKRAAVAEATSGGRGDHSLAGAAVRAYLDARGLGRTSDKDKVLFYSFLACAADVESGQRYVAAAAKQCSRHLAYTSDPPRADAQGEIRGILKSSIALAKAEEAAKAKKKRGRPPKKKAAVAEAPGAPEPRPPAD